MDDLVVTSADVMIDCPKCGQHKPANAQALRRGMCTDCSKAYSNHYHHTAVKKNPDDWMALARESGLDIWLQQPGETQQEYSIWVAYRDSYPGRKPNYGVVAEQLGIPYESVRNAAQRWSYAIRMQVWMAECDRITMLQRRNEILDMNKQHIDMAAKLREKLAVAIDSIEPSMLKPSEIGTLAKLATELERKARLDTIDQDDARHELLVDTENPELKKAPTKQSDLSDVVGILLKAGALGDITQIGVRRTETTEVVVTDDQGASSTLLQEV